MAHFGSSIEYALHCLLWLTEPYGESVPSSRDLAELQGVPAPYMAKILPKLQKAGLLAASDGVQGGYQLARPADAISVLDVIDAIDSGKPLFNCQEVRGNCVVFGGETPRWASQGVCGIHAVMIRAEKAMRKELSETNLAQLANAAHRKAPAAFAHSVQSWLDERLAARTARDTGT